MPAARSRIPPGVEGNVVIAAHRDTFFRKVEGILTRRQDDLERIAHELIQKETLDRGQIEFLLLPHLQQVPA